MTAFENIKFRILIVDDEPSNIQLIAKILDRNQYNLAYAEDGPSAIDMAMHISYDLILLDVNMPDMDGFEVCRKFKDKERLSDIPVIFLTARSEIEDVIQGFRIGGVDYVTKPFNDLELTARIRNQLELKSRRDTLKTELNFRERIMSEYALILEKRQALGQTIIQDLELLNRESPGIMDDQVQVIIRKLQTIFEDIDFKTYEFSFNELQERFQQRLLEKFSNLTTNEVRLGTYLRLNMSSREISDITRQSVRALEAARSRLRKKLKLNSSDNLVSYLQRF
ncbi:MAG: response regulator [Bacteroidota bacterium]|nr:response regulator [Bacteroidota bacterium]